MKYIFAVTRETAWAEDHMHIDFLEEKIWGLTSITY